MIRKGNWVVLADVKPGRQHMVRSVDHNGARTWCGSYAELGRVVEHAEDKTDSFYNDAAHLGRAPTCQACSRAVLSVLADAVDEERNASRRMR